MGYIPPGADTVIPFKTGNGGGLETLIFVAPYDIAERYFTHITLDGNTLLPETNGSWQSTYEMVMTSEVIVSRNFSVLSLTVETG